MSEYETVEVRQEGGVRTIALDRPEALNAWNKQLGEDLLDALRQAAHDPESRCVVLTGNGRAFSSGADLKDMSTDDVTPDGRPDVYKVLTQRYHPIMTAVRTMEKPVVAAINGPAVGIGLSLALCADLIVARESAYVLLAFVNIGLVPDGGSSLFIPARAGFTRAAEMALMGERVTAAQAYEWNLVNRVIPDAEFAATVEELATRLATGPTASFAGSKRQLNASLYPHMDEQLELEATIQQEMAASGDFIEGVTAFVQKRTARFSGR